MFVSFDCGLQTFKVGAMIVVVCSQGYQLNGGVVRRCLENGSWSSGRPECTPISCPSLTAVANGQLTGNDTLLNTVVEYRCNDGFRLQGTDSVL